MKKHYIKPTVEAVEFQLGGSVIAACKYITNNQMYQCAVDIPGLGTIFTLESSCDYIGEEGDVCNFTPQPGFNVYWS